MNAPTPKKDFGFIETLFGFRVDPMRVVQEQSTCVVCGGWGFHTHVFSSGKS